MLRIDRRSPAEARGSESGFTLIELVVAMMVIATVLLVLMAVQTSALVTITQAKQRQQATAFGNAAMEQLRALPWRSLQHGTHASFVAASGGDPNVTMGKLTPPNSPAISEILVTSTAQATDIPPLSGPAGTNRFVKTDAATGNLEFEVRSYVTRSTSASGSISVGDEPINLTVIVSWTPRNTKKVSSTVVRSEAFMPWGGCGDPTNTVFLGACQAVYASSVDANGVSLSVAPAPVGGTPLPANSPLLGSTTLDASLRYGSSSASMSSQQTTTVSGVGTQPSLSQRLSGVVNPVLTGGVQSENKAGTAIGGATGLPADPAPISVSGGVSSPTAIAGVPVGPVLTLTPGSASVVARSSTVKSCTGLPPAPGTPAGQPCGEGSVQGNPASGLTLTVGGSAFDVFKVQSYGIDARTTRFAASGSPQVGCNGTKGTGCASVDARRNVGTVIAGATPTGPLVTISNFSDQLLLDYGVNAMVNAPIRSMSGTITHPGGTCILGTACLTPTAPIVLGETSWVAGATTVKVSGQIQMSTGTELRINLDPSCRTDTCSLTAESSQVTVVLTYVLQTGAVTQSFTMTSNLGSSRGSVQYRAAPLG